MGIYDNVDEMVTDLVVKSRDKTKEKTKAAVSAVSQAQFDKKWANANPGDEITAPNGKTYRKPKK